MSSPHQILSYYPTYSILDEVLANGNYNTLNIYCDLKNNLQTLYMEHSILELIDNTLKTGYIDSSIFESIMYFISFLKNYSLSRNIKINFTFFLETGKSSFHLNISKKYKISRRIDDLYGLDREKRELFFKILQNNFMLFERAANKMPNIKVIRLKNLEADFIPYYLITRNLVDVNENNAHIIFSNDHDLLQCLKPNVFVFSKVGKTKKIVKKNESIKSYLKLETQFPDSYLPLIMAIIGDTGDDVFGIKGIGPKTTEKIISEVVELVGGIENLYKNILNNKEIFPSELTFHQNKYINEIIEKEKTEKLISNNLKLVSFEVLSRYVDDPLTTEMLERKKYIHEICNSKDCVEMEVMKGALEKNRIFLEQGILENIYFQS